MSSGDDAGQLRPGDDIRPHMGPAEAQALASALYGLPSGLNVRQLNAYDDKNFHLTIPEAVKNSLEWEHGYVLKVLNSVDSKNAERVKAQNEIMIFLGSKGIVCSQPVKNIDGNYFSKEKLPLHPTKDGSEDRRKHYIVRLLTFQPGDILFNVPCTPSLLYQIGNYIAHINILLKDFHHPGLENHNSIWMLQSVPQVKKFIFGVSDPDKRKLAGEIIQTFENEVIPKIPSLEKGPIHGDFNEQNILVRRILSNEWQVHGVIDWGDSHISCYVFELAITICYMMLQSKMFDPFEAPGHVIAGYIKIRSIPEGEFHLLKKCISARLCQSLVLGAYTYSTDPTNEYLLTTSKTGWQLLNKLWTISEDDLYHKWKRIVDSYVK